MRIIDGNTIETECDSCACTFTTTRGEDGEPDYTLCWPCFSVLQDLRKELAKERDRVWLETFLSFPFKALPEPEPVFRNWCCDCENCGGDHLTADCPDLKAWREHQDLMDAADQAAYYSPEWRDE